MRPGKFPKSAQLHQRMAESRNDDIQTEKVTAPARCGADHFVILRARKTNLSWRKFDMLRSGLALQIEDVHDSGWFRGMNMNVHHFAEAVKRPLFEEGFEPSIRRHGLLLRLSDSGVGVCSPNPQMAAG